MKSIANIIQEEIANVMIEDYNHADYLRWKRQNVTIRGIQELGKENNGMASFGQGLYTAALSNKELARKYGKVYFVVGAIPKHPKTVNTWNDAEIFIQKVVMIYGKERGIDDYDWFATIFATCSRQDSRHISELQKVILRAGCRRVNVKGSHHVYKKGSKILTVVKPR